jgi:hypothetical protein
MVEEGTAVQIVKVVDHGPKHQYELDEQALR